MLMNAANSLLLKTSREPIRNQECISDYSPDTLIGRILLIATSFFIAIILTPMIKVMSMKVYKYIIIRYK